MSHTNAWNESTPLGTENASTTDDYLRQHRLDLGERFEEMFYGFSTSDNTGAENDYGAKSIKFYKQSSDPTSATDYAHVYIKIVDGVPELFYQDDENTTKQLTSGGQLNIVDADGAVVKTGSQTIAGTKTFSDITSLADASIMASSAAPTANAMITNKKYVDDEIDKHYQYAKYIYKTAENTQGAQPTKDAWTKYPLSNEESDDDSIGTISSSAITLAAGTYRVSAAVALYRTGVSRLRIRDTTGASTLTIGTNINLATAGNDQSICAVSGSFTISTESVIELQYYVLNNSDNGLGEKRMDITGESEYWGSLEFWKIN